MAESVEESLNIAESLKSLGLTKYEALVYIALLKVAGATATEIHEISGVPRASVYPVLDRLTQKNLVSVSNTSPKRFDAIAPDEGINNLLTHIETNADEAKNVLNEIFSRRIGAERGTQELIWSIAGRENIYLRINDLIRHAGISINIFTNRNVITDDLMESLRISGSNAVPIEIITTEWDFPPMDNVSVFVKKINPDHMPHKGIAGAVFFFDCRRVMVIMGQMDDGLTALYSESEGFVRFFTTYWRFFKDWAKS
ncbi:MAG TPA: helix-turn-helix domain-containing protein [Methanoregulaceae archaeon]|nr:helix-turn-helix domain-containing protein [Methanoregulaceae archaeon]